MRAAPASLKDLHDEAREFAATRARLASSGWTASWLIAFKGVLLEGLEVWLVVVAFGLHARAWASSGAGALAALLLVATAGLAIRAPLLRVPQNAIKFAVGRDDHGLWTIMVGMVNRALRRRYTFWSQVAITRHATLLALLTTLQIADIATTKVAVARGDTELNPVASLAFGASGILTAALLFKLALVLWAVIFAALARRARPLLIGAIVVYSLVVVNNLTVVF